MNNFAKNLKSYRVQKGLTQLQLTKMLKVGVATVSHWETKQSEPDINMLITLASIFEITLDELIKE